MKKNFKTKSFEWVGLARQCLGTLNNKKMGKHRRGMLLLTDWDACKNADGLWDVSLTWFVRKRQHAEFGCYDYQNHAKLIKNLVVNNENH